jgi:hypothetical protein
MKYLLIILFLTGCTNIPLKDEFNRIHRKPYKLNIYDCSNKSAEYHDLLVKAGYKPQIVNTQYMGLSVIKDGVLNFKIKPNFHTIVYCDGKYLDITANKVYTKEWMVIYIGRLNNLHYLTKEEFKELRIKKPKEWNY